MKYYHEENRHLLLCQHPEHPRACCSHFQYGHSQHAALCHHDQVRLCRIKKILRTERAEEADDVAGAGHDPGPTAGLHGVMLGLHTAEERSSLAREAHNALEVRRVAAH